LLSDTTYIYIYKQFNKRRQLRISVDLKPSSGFDLKTIKYIINSGL